MAIGSIGNALAGTTEDVSFQLFDVTARWKTKLSSPSSAFGGMDAIGLALGFSSVDGDTDVDNNEETILRFGPVFFLGAPSGGCL